MENHDFDSAQEAFAIVELRQGKPNHVFSKDIVDKDEVPVIVCA